MSFLPVYLLAALFGYPVGLIEDHKAAALPCIQVSCPNTEYVGPYARQCPVYAAVRQISKRAQVVELD